MKILIVCNCASGLERFRGMLIEELIKKGNVVNAIVPLSKEKKELDAESRIEKMKCEMKHISMERRGVNPGKNIKLFATLLMMIRKIDADMIITYTIKPNIYGGIICRFLRIPYVVNITGLGSAFQKKNLLYKLVVAMYKVALKNAKVVFFENSENRDVMINTGIISNQKTHVLAGAGVDLEYFQYLEYPCSKDIIYFLFIGRVMKEKGVDELFDAMKKLYQAGYNCKLEILGNFEENYTSDIMQYEKEGWLHYIGYQEDVRPYIQKCHCLVLPSWHEGMANTILESAACGRPVIASNIHGCLEGVIENETGYLVKVKDAEDLYEVMKRFLLLPNKERIAMGKNGRKYMKEKIDKKNIVRETMNEMF